MSLSNFQPSSLFNTWNSFKVSTTQNVTGSWLLPSQLLKTKNN